MPFPILLAVMAAASAAKAASDASRAKKDKGLYDTAASGVQPVNPNENAFVGKVQQQERQFRAGTDASSAFAIRGIQNAGAQYGMNAVRASGGNTGAAVNGLLSSQAQTNEGIARVGANAADRANSLLGLEGTYTSHIADKILKQQEYKRGFAYSQLIGAQQDRNNSINNLIGVAGYAADKYDPKPKGFKSDSNDLGGALAGTNSGNVGLPMNYRNQTTGYSNPFGMSGDNQYSSPNPFTPSY